MRQIKNAPQNKKMPSCQHLLICNNSMVRQCDLSWNPIYDSILLMYQKLEDLGFVDEVNKGRRIGRPSVGIADTPKGPRVNASCHPKSPYCGPP